MSIFKMEWNLEMALEVIGRETVDGETWSEAAKWLMLYGPPEIQDMLQQAASIATSKFYPELQPTHYSENGDPCYNINDLAHALGLTEEELQQKVKKMEFEREVQLLYEESNTNKVH